MDGTSDCRKCNRAEDGKQHNEKRVQICHLILSGLETQVTLFWDVLISEQ